MGGSQGASLIENVACSNLSYHRKGKHTWRFTCRWPRLKELTLIVQPPDGESSIYSYPDGSFSYLLEDSEDLLESVSQSKPGAWYDNVAFRLERWYYWAA